MNSIYSQLIEWSRLFAIQKSHRLSLLLAFLTGVLAYAIFIFHHLLSDHGVSSMPWFNANFFGTNFGRWMFVPIVAFGYNADIPVINALMGVGMFMLRGAIVLQSVSRFWCPAGRT
jgi:hypothetical protein